MPRNPRYDLLFEPVRIGPKVAPNRFYQTPHATGMGYLKPRSGAALRGIKAEGGWGVVCTEYCSIHPTSDDSPYAFLSLWDDDDVAALAKTAEAIHAHGSLAGVELWHGGLHANNRLTREPPVAPSGQPVHYPQPGHARALDRSDIKALRGWQVAAAKRARSAGFDIVYVYAGHDYLPFQFLSPTTNRRGDEYGGSLVNRVRLLREMIEETREAVGHDCAVAVRLGVDELLGPQGITAEGEGCEILSLLAELPDLWDVNLAGGLGNDSTSARFSPEGFQERYVGFVKQVTTKPVVSVGRFTSPDAMLDQVKRGILDFVGAARPSIADPFLPRKIDEGREDEIRECIGCNICRSANNEGVPLRCTENPTIGEEWRRGWHPERIAPAPRPERVLIVGGGPAGLECARTLGERGHEVSLAEARRELGGRLLAESRLPGLATWIRVRDWRLGQIRKRNNVALYPESPMTAEDVLEIAKLEASKGELFGVIVQFGGQTPLKLAKALEDAGIPIFGTSPDAIDLAEDRERFADLVSRLDLMQPDNGIARSKEEALAVARRIGYPVLMRPSYVLGGRAMEIVDSDAQLENYIETAVQVSGDSPVLIDQYLRDAIEVDVDAIADGTDVVVAGVLQHIEEAGVHSGDSACTIPPYSLPDEVIAEIERQTDALARALKVRGLMNVQYAVKDGEVFLIEVNPRASRTVPFVAKAIGHPIAKIAARVMAGEKLADLPAIDRHIDHIAVKEAVFPFARFTGTDPVLSPEMKSTGEVMGIDSEFAIAFAKSQLGGGVTLPSEGTVFVSVKDGDKNHILEPVRSLSETGFAIVATGGTQTFLEENGIPAERVNKVAQGRPHIVDAIVDGEIDLIFNTTEGWQSLQDSASIRKSAVSQHIPYYTTAPASAAAALAIGALRTTELEVRPLQAYYHSPKR